ncbi:MAG: DUF4399 domain-containing protein [Aquabacterium sp.]|nr:MAG: DUF4399 domain-containing protein [Aquabacterium sp.]
MTRPSLYACAAVLVACSLAPALALSASSDHPWVQFPLQKSEPENYITNLRDGDSIETPFLMKFGLTRFGIAGITTPVQGTGHHHLLVNRDLPLDFTKPLPFNDQYIHFGKGQMETVLTFKPGTYTLRMLLADHHHIPYFIYSKPIRITVTRLRTDVDPKSLVTQGVSILTPRGGETVKGPFRVQFHASGLNVSHMNVKDNNAGHFVLTIEGGGPPQRILYTNGWTETWLKPPPGSYKLKLSLISNADPFKELAAAQPISVTVAK